jgi:hypothetical protein
LRSPPGRRRPEGEEVAVTPREGFRAAENPPSSAAKTRLGLVVHAQGSSAPRHRDVFTDMKSDKALPLTRR